MDEPFGAIDPINRATLQEGFLALQQQVRKTVVFVTHDIDEAIKLGDRIAILREGGALAQYATPAEILDQPGRRLRRRVRRRRPRAQAPWPGDARRRRAADDERRQAGGSCRSTMNVRDALSAVLAAGGQPLRVVDENGEVRGLATLESIGACLRRQLQRLADPTPSPAAEQREPRYDRRGGPIIPHALGSPHQFACESGQPTCSAGAGSARTGRARCGRRCASTSCSW